MRGVEEGQIGKYTRLNNRLLPEGGNNIHLLLLQFVYFIKYLQCTGQGVLHTHFI